MQTVAAAARGVLATADPANKVKAARSAARDWRAGRLVPVWDVRMPDRPARPDRPELLPPARMPKRGRGGTAAGRIAMLHAIAHIEFIAIDLAFDLIGRFGAGFPPAFLDDWFGVGADEAMHFALLDRRLRALGSAYGALPAHDGLVAGGRRDRRRCARAARDRADGAGGARARRHAGDDRSLRGGRGRDLRQDHDPHRRDEIVHVAAGVRWYRNSCEQDGLAPCADLAQARSRAVQGPFDPSIQRLGAREGRSDESLLHCASQCGNDPADIMTSSREGQFSMSTAQN
jgi:uncharacterized ferritin-like protein (DUF455 family)